LTGDGVDDIGGRAVVIIIYTDYRVVGTCDSS